MKESSRLIGALKQEWKQRGWTYRTVAKIIGRSEASVKRLVGQQTLSLAQIDSICAELNLTLSEILARHTGLAANSSAEKSDQFTEEEELFLAQDHVLFRCFFMVNMGLEFEQIQKRLGSGPRPFGRARLTRILFSLQREGLIEYTTDQRITSKKRRNVRWIANGPLFRAYFPILAEVYFSAESGDPESHGLGATHTAIMEMNSGPLSQPALAYLSRRLKSLNEEVSELIRLECADRASRSRKAAARGRASGTGPPDTRNSRPKARVQETTDPLEGDVQTPIVWTVFTAKSICSADLDRAFSGAPRHLLKCTPHKK